MKKLGLAVGLALAMAMLTLAWSAWAGTRVAQGGEAKLGWQRQDSVSPGDVVINEVAWMGTGAAHPADEWIELYNPTGEDIDLSGWTLAAVDGTPSITLSGMISARGYFLLERSHDDESISDIPADQTFTGGLGNDPEAESLELEDAAGRLVDTANSDGGAWPGGTVGGGTPAYATMERVNPWSPDTDANWATNDGLTRNGLDADGEPINGTPRAQNSVYAVPGLVVDKIGPAVVTAGLDFTGHIVLSNSGTSIATGVVVTDLLPSGLSFVAQSSPFTFTQLSAGTLLWRVGALPAGARHLITLTLRPADTLTGSVTNVVTATDDAGSKVTAAWPVPIVPHVRLYALHPHALHAGDEAAALVNLGTVTATVTGWGLDNGDAGPRFTLPQRALSPGEIIWLTKNADDFHRAFGLDADLAVTYTAHAVPLLDGAWPPYFSNSGDEAVLFDGAGHPVDTLVYGAGKVATEGWEGEAVPYPRAGFGEGQILYRKLDQATGLPVPDTDTAADWAQAADDDIDGKKVRFPGWDFKAFFFPAQVTQTAALTVWVAPDGLYEGIAGALQKAQGHLFIQGYTFESPELAGLITGLLHSGVSVTMLLEGQPAFGIEAQELWACEQMADAGADIYFMHNDESAGIHDRYKYQHAKFILIDGTVVLIGSENLTPGGMPADDKADGTWGHRGVYLATDAPGVVARAQAIFEHDLDLAHSDIVPWGSYGYTAPSVFTPTYGANWVTYTARFSRPLALADEFAFEVIQSPENSLRDRDALLGLLARAGGGDTILVEQLYEHLFWGGGTAEDANPRLEAYIAAARRGAAVRLLLDSHYDDRYYDDEKVQDNRATADYVNDVARREGLNLAARLGNPTGQGIHSKMTLAWISGRGYVHAGSLNGSENSNKENRELALQVQSDGAYLFLKEVFDHDWDASWQSDPGVTHVYLPLVAHDYVPPADHPVISELLYDPEGVDDKDGEWVEIYNPTGMAVGLSGYSLSDGGSYGDGTAVFPGGSLGPGGVVVVAQRADVFSATYGFLPDFELRESDPAVPNLSPEESGIGWGNGGDEAILRDASGVDVDVVVYGAGSYPGVTPHPGVGWGNSLARKPAGRDTDDCSVDFWERYTPAPGQVTLDRARSIDR